MITGFLIYKQEDVENQWVFRNFKDGNCYYIHIKDYKKILSSYPYLSDLKQLLQFFQKVLQYETKSKQVKYKKNYIRNIVKNLRARNQ